ncbi:protein kinase [Paenibacillus larvae]|uniref:Serine/threonine protein kinase n=6 Tax=Paenibacillus larvae TaxID=1464 RepID=A0A1V0UTR9_9BACL|nr:protein kinase [Paenibacillus larvae]AQZ47192.1 serine/threonine protein kinase [Paenibacillus larvae subsp. pulvifaciens]ARF68551.1 serine/threonine protein kinase [Paenibacillus larvae subsp. pulvifaciens]AVF24054.1 putative serine/threonine-protein kinase YabT [Paenibacillus larvae subsp. larvae]AVF24485.1 putative serine/threonine-protein kinase YabT [Paenibacillus larvae subsp. larvae]AVF29246.1 putative serine/threonine-protein kinase YabT [Paenibacillus larvae subsp. larvae]
MTTWYKDSLVPGMTLKGKWNGRAYLVEKLLGAGANGQVMLVRSGQQRYAMKIGFDPLDHQSEVNALKEVSEKTTTFRGYLIDVDDAVIQGKETPFFVMKYIEGKPLLSFLADMGIDWIYMIGLQILKRLRDLHANGWIFGDLKIENMVVCGYGQAELIDFGGVTPKGKAVKQFTEMYDRGYWNAGERLAEEGYDLFSFAVMVILAVAGKNSLGDPALMLPQNRSIDMLEEVIKANPCLKKLSPFLLRALRGTFSGTREAVLLWKQLYAKPRNAVSSSHPSWVKVCFFVSLLMLGTTLYYFHLR